MQKNHINKIKICFLSIFLLLSLIITGARYAETSKTISFYSPSKGIYIVDVDTEKCPECLNIYVSDTLETVENVAENTGSVAAINGGYFDPANNKTSSYIIKNGLIVDDPTYNQHLMRNSMLKPYLPAILNRSEFRFLDCNGKKQFEIVQHNQPPLINCNITDSIQGGPELLPQFKLYEEAFAVKKNGKIIRQAAGSLGKYARSAIGIKNNHVLLIAVSSKAGMTLEQLARYLRKLGIEQALALDGGSSTSLYVNLPDSQKFILTSAKDNAARKVKSFILVKNQAT